MKKLLCALACLATVSMASAQKTVTVEQGELKLRLDTRVTVDGAIYIPGTDLEGWTSSGNGFRFSNGANITQARFGVWGTLGERWTGKIDVKVVDRQIQLQDVFLDYKIKPQSLYLRTGYYVDPVSVECNAASSYLSLNTPMALSLLAHQTRFLTLSLTSFSKHHYAVVGLYGSSLGANRNKINRGNDGWGVTVKGAYLPINEEGNTLYFGLYGRYRTPDVSITGQRHVLTYATHPGSTIDGRNFITGTLSQVSRYALFGGEVAMTRGRWHFMAEYLANNIFFKDGNLYGNRSSAFFHGGYLTASYMLFGKQRKYLDYWGIFSPLANIPKTGALELIGRFSYANANDKDSRADILLGSGYVGTIGINWYPSYGNLLIGLNYNYSSFDRYGRSSITAPAGKSDSRFNFHTLQCRLQYVF